MTLAWMSEPVITDVSDCRGHYDVAVARWKPDSPGRLQQAALALFGERGYEHTTVAQIAARAGVTERTFFRHYADKREVLFDAAGRMQELLVSAVVEAEPSAGAFAAAIAGVQAAAEVLETRRGFARQRQMVIAANAELREREALKLTAWAGAIDDALQGRGVPAPAASLAGEVAVGVFRIAFEAWVSDGEERALVEIMHESLAQLEDLLAQTSPAKLRSAHLTASR
jgi:AcrR family transcriptional regulator